MESHPRVIRIDIFHNIADTAVLKAIGQTDGGLIETSGDILHVDTNAVIDAAGITGKAGEWFIDPVDIIISNEQPEGYTDVTPTSFESVSTDQYYESQSATTEEKHSYLNADYISWRLSNGTSVRIQALDTNPLESDKKLYSLGWHPLFSISEGISHTIETLSAHNL